MQAQSMLDDVQLAVVTHLVNGIGLSQKFSFESHDIVVECTISPDAVRLWMSGLQPCAKARAVCDFLHLLQQVVRVGLKVSKSRHQTRGLGLLLSLVLTTLYIDGQQQSQTNKKHERCGTYGQALIASSDPGDQAITQGSHNAGKANGKCP